MVVVVVTYSAVNRGLKFLLEFPSQGVISDASERSMRLTLEVKVEARHRHSSGS